jgi:hypothetical protein
MDLSLFLRVLWRFRILLAAGTALAAALALLTVMHVELEDGQPKFRYREPVLWSAHSTLLVTQEGFPWGRSILDEMVAVPAETPEPALVPRFATPDRFISLALLYSELANSDSVRREVLPRDAGPSTYEAATVPDRGGAGYLPLIRVTGTSTSPANAVWVAERATSALKAFIDRQQDTSRIAPRNRVQLNVVRKPEEAQISSKRSFVKPAFVFLLILTIFIGLAFVLQNLRPSPDQLAVESTTGDPVSSDPVAIGLRRQA